MTGTGTADSAVAVKMRLLYNKHLKKSEILTMCPPNFPQVHLWCFVSLSPPTHNVCSGAPDKLTKIQEKIIFLGTCQTIIIM